VGVKATGPQFTAHVSKRKSSTHFITIAERVVHNTQILRLLQLHLEHSILHRTRVGTDLSAVITWVGLGLCAAEPHHFSSCVRVN
jgi:hypothetical protein